MPSKTCVMGLKKLPDHFKETVTYFKWLVHGPISRATMFDYGVRQSCYTITSTVAATGTEKKEKRKTYSPISFLD